MSGARLMCSVCLGGGVPSPISTCHRSPASPNLVLVLGNTSPLSPQIFDTIANCIQLDQLVQEVSLTIHVGTR